MPKTVREMDWTGGDPPTMTIMLVGDGEKPIERWKCLLCGQNFRGGSVAIMLGSPQNSKGRVSLHARCAEALGRKLAMAVRTLEGNGGTW